MNARTHKAALHAMVAELTAIDSIDRRADENRRIRYAVAVGLVSAVTIPTSFDSGVSRPINASQVAARRSMFSHQYLGMCPAVAAVIALGAVLSLALYVQQRHDARHHRTAGARSRWTLAADDTHY